MRWFRQDEPITEEQQYGFIEYDLLYHKYFGLVIELNNKPIGLCNLKDTNEFGIAILPEYQKYTREVLKDLNEGAWSDVFVDNPILGWYLTHGFKATKAREREYYKKEIGFVDIVRVEKMGNSNVCTLKRKKM